MSTIGELADALNRIAPLNLAAQWDNVGLLLGARQRPVERLLTCLTVTPEVVSEAVAERVDLIVTHHPILFRGVKQLSSDTPDGRLLLPLLQAGIGVYSPHTAFDNAPGGINDQLAAVLGLQQVEPLRPRLGKNQFKIVVFVPESDLEKVAAAIFTAGGGQIGDYTHCSYRLHGKGTFLGGDTTNPTIGQRGQLEEVAEIRFETVCPAHALDRVIASMRQAHSYEEPAFDVYPLHPLSGSGEGRRGRFELAVPLQELANRLKAGLRVPTVQFVGDPNRPIHTLALACGAAGEYLDDALQVQADAFLTGEMRFHELLRAQAESIAVVLPGHYASERPAVEALASKLAADWPDLTIWASRQETNPTQWL